jgi:hypothetical protein
VGNKSDMADEKRAVPYAKGQALADEYKIQFFETSAKDNSNVEEVGRGCCCLRPPACSTNRAQVLMPLPGGLVAWWAAAPTAPSSCTQSIAPTLP